MTTAKPVALVTGASSGIGKAAALALVDAGFEVVGTSRNTSGVAPLDKVTFLDLDVTSDESVTGAIEELLDRFGRLDVLVNNAGTGAAAVIARAMADGDAPAFVANAIVAAATDPKPKLRYTVGSTAGRVSALRRFVPTRVFARQIRKLNRLPA